MVNSAMFIDNKKKVDDLFILLLNFVVVYNDQHLLFDLQSQKTGRKCVALAAWNVPMEY